MKKAFRTTGAQSPHDGDVDRDDEEDSFILDLLGDWISLSLCQPGLGNGAEPSQPPPAHFSAKPPKKVRTIEQDESRKRKASILIPISNKNSKTAARHVKNCKISVQPRERIKQVKYLRFTGELSRAHGPSFSSRLASTCPSGQLLRCCPVTSQRALSVVSSADGGRRAPERGVAPRRSCAARD